MRFWVNVPRLPTINEDIQSLSDDDPRAWSHLPHGWHIVHADNAPEAAEKFAAECTGFRYPMRVLVVQLEGEEDPLRFLVGHQYTAVEVRA